MTTPFHLCSLPPTSVPTPTHHPLGTHPIMCPTSQSLAPQLFAMSLFPYLCFLFYLTKSGKTPKLTLFGFYFLLAFVGATIPAGIYGKASEGSGSKSETGFGSKAAVVVCVWGGDGLGQGARLLRVGGAWGCCLLGCRTICLGAAQDVGAADRDGCGYVALG